MSELEELFEAEVTWCPLLSNSVLIAAPSVPEAPNTKIFMGYSKNSETK
jgi:hypothetical protein